MFFALRCGGASFLIVSFGTPSYPIHMIFTTMEVDNVQRIL